MEASVVTTSSGNTGPLGQPRASARDPLHRHPRLLQLVLGLQDRGGDGQAHREGLGGVLGLVIWILIQPVMAFVIPSEIGKMYRKDEEPPLSGWTGLWLFPGAILIIPAIVWFVKVQGALNDYWESKGATAP